MNYILALFFWRTIRADREHIERQARAIEAVRAGGPYR